MSVARTLRTLRHVRPRQLVAQALHVVGRTGLARDIAPSETSWALGALVAEPPPAPSHARWDGAGRIELIARPVEFGALEDIDFRHAAAGPLWAYQLHFFEWARSGDAPPDARARAIEHWQRTTPYERGSTGWDSHPISVRTLSWLKLRFGGGLPDAFAGTDADDRMRASLACQVDWLARHLETRLQANHLLENRIAIAAAGHALDGRLAEHWRMDVAPLVDEIEEQVGVDGAHYERSPMYHAVMLEHLLDLLNVVRSSRLSPAVGLEARLASVAARMLGALELMTHPDGEIALVADAVFGIAQPPAALVRYAAALGVEPVAPPSPGRLPSVGLARLASGPFSLLASYAGPSPPHQPGHAHCDALSFELCVGGERVVVDAGVYEYVAGEARTRVRATASHATLEIGGEEQAEIWSAHRVGGRPHVACRSASEHALEAVCRGWATPRTVHRRRFEVTEAGVTIDDALDGDAAAVRAFLPLAPGLAPRLEADRLRVALQSGRELEVMLPAGFAWAIERAPYHPRFGVAQERAVLVGRCASFRAGRWQLRVVDPA